MDADSLKYSNIDSDFIEPTPTPSFILSYWHNTKAELKKARHDFISQITSLFRLVFLINLHDAVGSVANIRY